MNHSVFDKRNYPVVDVRAGYGEWSRTYEQDVLDEMDLRLLNRVQTVDWQAQDRILDLACGTGRIGVWLKEHTSSSLDGVDLTPEMLEQAESKGVYRHLHHASITETGLPDDSYNLCIQSLADEHLADVNPLYIEAARVTKPAGYFVIVGFHPQFMMMGIPTHYDRIDGESITVQTYVHLLSDHIKAAYASGWSLLEIDEGIIDDDWVRQKPKWDKHYGLPISFVMVWQR